MVRNAGDRLRRIVSGFLAMLMLLSLIPGGAVNRAFAAVMPLVFTVNMPEGFSQEETPTIEIENEGGENETFVSVFENGRAVFLGGGEGIPMGDYTLRIGGMQEYQDIVVSGVSVSEDSTEYTVAEELIKAKEIRAVSFVDTEAAIEYGGEYTAALTDAALTGVTFACVDNTVAQVDAATGVVTTVGMGETEITATVPADGIYREATASMKLVVNVATAGAIHFAESEIVLKVGEEATVAVVRAEDGKATGDVAYTSSDSETIEVDEETGTIYAHKETAEGTPVTITANFTADEDSYYADCAATYTVTVTKNAVTLAFAQDSVTVKYGETVENALTVEPEEAANDANGTVKYSSSAGQVAKVDEITGAVTLVGVGNTVITAKYSGSKKYANAEVAYTLNVEKGANALSFDANLVTSIMIDTPIELKAVLAEGAKGKVTYSIDKPEFADVDDNGMVTPKKASDFASELEYITLTAKFTPDEDSNYAAATATHSFSISRKVKDIRFKENSVSCTYGKEAPKNTLEDLQELEGGTITYSSSDTNVATVNGETGEVTILNAGSTTIKAEMKGHAEFKDDDAIYTLIVKRAPIEIDLVLEKEFGQDDPNLIAAAKEQIAGQIVSVDADEKDTLVVALANQLAPKYKTLPGIEADEGRASGEYEIEFAEVIGEDKTLTGAENYRFESAQGKLTVNAGFAAEKPTHYDVTGLKTVDGVLWGKTEDGVKITAASGYKISEKIGAGSDWKEFLEYNAAAEEQNYTFYVRKEATHAVSSLTTVKFAIDGDKPEIDGFNLEKNGNPLLSFLTFGVFGNKEIKLTVFTRDKSPSSGLKEVELHYGTEPSNMEEPGHKKPVDADGKAVFTLTAEQFAVLKYIRATVSDNVGYSTTAYVDKSNTEYEGNAIAENFEGMLQIESIMPVIGVDYADAIYPAMNDQKWYGEDQEFTVTVTDLGKVNSGIRSVSATINDKPVKPSFTKGTPANVQDNVYDFVDKKTEEVIFIVNTKLDDEDDRPTDGKYTLKVTAVDNAGNELSIEKVIYIDREAPVVTDFDFALEDDSATVVDGAVVDSTGDRYGLFFTADTKVTVTVEDTTPTSGVKEVMYYLVAAKDGSLVGPQIADDLTQVEDEPGKWTATFTVKEGFRGQIFARATDNVMHVGEYEQPNAAAIEDSNTHKDHASAEIALVSDTEVLDNDGHKLFADSNTAPVELTLTVEDTFSGIGSVTWTVKTPDGGTVTDENLTVGSYLEGNVPQENTTLGTSEWTVAKTDSNLITRLTRSIKVTEESNSLTVELSFTDRAGNPTTADPVVFSIDNTAPVIELTLGNDSPDTTYNNIYNSDQSVTLTVHENNFDPALVNISGMSVSGWTTTGGINSKVHTATVSFTTDGDYSISANLTDLVGHASNTVETAFTVDKTMPTVSVAYNNNAAMNGNYYNADRVATITVVEHNFDASRVTITGTAANGSIAVAFPELIGWSSDGDTRTATIRYSADALYTFDIDMADMAGNPAADFEQQTFYIDQTAPAIEISGVADKSANNGDVAPVITFTDTNYDASTLSVQLAGANNGTVTYDGTRSAVVNGQVYTFANFEKVKDVDDLYTLTVSTTDLAGNVTTQTITFSVNRFGSVYDLSEVEDMLGKYLPQEKDIVVTETNVDSLKLEDLRIKLTKNGTPVDLVEGVDFEVEVIGGDGEWSQYRYIIKSELFADDGRYSIAFYSVDAAGNINENIDEDKGAEISFGIDKNLPVVVPVDFESGVQYAVELKTVSVEIKDNLVLEDVKIYLNGSEVAYRVEGENYIFDIPELNSTQDVVIVAVDAAGNVLELPIEDFLVSTNIFVRWYNNTPLFIGSVAGTALLILGLIVFIVFGKKKKTEEAEA